MNIDGDGRCSFGDNCVKMGVPLLPYCNKKTSEHLVGLDCATENLQIPEALLILNRAGVHGFGFMRSSLAKRVCTMHRNQLGISWKPGKEKCCHPLHDNTSFSPVARSATIFQSREIWLSLRTHVPIGAGFCSQCVEKHNHKVCTIKTDVKKQMEEMCKLLERVADKMDKDESMDTEELMNKDELMDTDEFKADQCSFGDNCKERGIDLLRYCYDDTSAHLQTLKCATENLQIPEPLLILNRAGVHGLGFMRSSLTTYVCSKHRKELGITWKPEVKKCCHPLHDNTFSDSVTTWITIFQSRKMWLNLGTHVPIGSGFCSQCVEKYIDKVQKKTDVEKEMKEMCTLLGRTAFAMDMYTEGSSCNLKDGIAVLFIGECGSGKSSTINTLLGKDICKAGITLRMGGITRKVQECHGLLPIKVSPTDKSQDRMQKHGQNVEGNEDSNKKQTSNRRNPKNTESSSTHVANTDAPQEITEIPVKLYDTPRLDEFVGDKSINRQGFHAIVFVFPLNRYTEERQKFTERVSKAFDGDLSQHVIFAFTHNKGQREIDEINDDIKNAGDELLNDLLAKSGERCILFDSNKNREGLALEFTEKLRNVFPQSKYKTIHIGRNFSLFNLLGK